MKDKKKIASFDLETIADPSCIPFLPEITKAQGKPGGEAWTRNIAVKQAEQVSKMGLNANQNLICCFGWCDESGSNHIMLEDEQSEKQLIEAMWEVLSRYDFFISFNGIWFDVPIINLHSMKNRVRIPVKISTRKYTIENHLDCYCVLSNWEKKPGKMDYYTQWLGIGKGKQGTDGSMVQEMWDLGEHAEIGAYCESDCVQTYEMGRLIMEYLL